jgi:hypothetical protein
MCGSMNHGSPPVLSCARSHTCVGTAIGSLRDGLQKVTPAGAVPSRPLTLTAAQSIGAAGDAPHGSECIGAVVLALRAPCVPPEKPAASKLLVMVTTSRAPAATAVPCGRAPASNAQVPPKGLRAPFQGVCPAQRRRTRAKENRQVVLFGPIYTRPVATCQSSGARGGMLDRWHRMANLKPYNTEHTVGAEALKRLRGRLTIELSV